MSSSVKGVALGTEFTIKHVTCGHEIIARWEHYGTISARCVRTVGAYATRFEYATAAAATSATPATPVGFPMTVHIVGPKPASKLGASEMQQRKVFAHKLVGAFEATTRDERTVLSQYGNSYDCKIQNPVKSSVVLDSGFEWEIQIFCYGHGITHTAIFF